MHGKEKKTANPLWITLGMIHPEWVYLPPDPEAEEEAETAEKEEKSKEETIRIHFRQRKKNKAP